jgi:hypothetical protein
MLWCSGSRLAVPPSRTRWLAPSTLSWASNLVRASSHTERFMTASGPGIRLVPGIGLDTPPLSPAEPRRIARGFSDVLLRWVVRPIRCVPEYGHHRMGLADCMLGVRMGL